MRRLLVAGGLALIGGAIAKELRKPPRDRHWHGRVVGLPYDFRPLTPAKLRATFWDPDNPAVLTPHGFGIGYGINLARVFGRRPSGV